MVGALPTGDRIPGMADLIEQLLEAARLLPPQVRTAAATIAVQLVLCTVAAPFLLMLDRLQRSRGTTPWLLTLVLVMPGTLAIIWMFVVIPTVAVAIRRSVILAS